MYITPRINTNILSLQLETILFNWILTKKNFKIVQFLSFLILSLKTLIEVFTRPCFKNVIFEVNKGFSLILMLFSSVHFIVFVDFHLNSICFGSYLCKKK
jgi:hypothetical protein